MICNPVLNDCTSSSDPTAYTNSALQAVISIFFIVGVVYFIWHLVFAGFHLIATDGDSKKLEESKNEIIYAITGLAVIFSVFALLRLVGTVFGISGLDSLQISWPSL